LVIEKRYPRGAPLLHRRPWSRERCPYCDWAEFEDPRPQLVVPWAIGRALSCFRCTIFSSTHQGSCHLPFQPVH
jgi:hypothetical protein